MDKDNELLGVCLFGSENNTYSVDFKIKSAIRRSVLVPRTAEFSSKLIQCEKCSYYGLRRK